MGKLGGGTRIAKFVYPLGSKTQVTCRSLSAGEAKKLSLIEDEDARSVAAISWSIGMTEEEAAAWYDQAPAGDAIYVLQEIMNVSGLTAAARFQG